MNVLLALLALGQPTTSETDRPALAINLAGVVDYCPEMPFVDVFKHSREWVPQADGQPWGKGPPLELTPEGYVKRLKPGQYATTLMCVAGGHPPGRYVCTYKGKGTLDFKGNAKPIRATAGRIELQVSAEETMFLHLRAVDPADPVRDIRVTMPGFEKKAEAEPFAPPFLARYRPFAAVRFMDWQKTNDSEQRTWADRPTLTDASQAIKGVAIEHMVDLANRLGNDPWFCMPHQADDEYIRQFARLVKTRLDPKLKVYIEHSNEVWNGQFQQARYAGKRGKELMLSDNAYQAQLFYHSVRSVEIFKIWEQEFGGTTRLVRVLAAQGANPWTSEQVVEFQDAYRHADALAIAPYFGNDLGDPKTAGEVAALSLDEVFARCRESIKANEESIRRSAAVARARDLDLIAYEAGQHLVGFHGAENNEALTAKLHAANRDPRMGQLYGEYLESWRASGGQLAAIFSSVARPSKWGSWGMLESERQDPKDATKYQAVMRFLRENPRWWDEARPVR